MVEIKRIDGILFSQMLANGFANLSAHEREVNDMNVFPVADGDTGTNMKLTLLGGIESSKECANLSNYLKKVSDGMLLSARGNSGVLLSQLFKGMSDGLNSVEDMSVADFISALCVGFKTAYASVANPVEGTILTVAREGTEVLVSKGFSDFRQLFEVYLEGMKKSLARTPQLLSKLQEAGVTDSGAYGFVLIMDGMKKYLDGIILEASEMSEEKEIDYSSFTENSRFDFGYCMEFLLRLLKAKENFVSFSKEDFTKQLETIGSSVVCVQNDTIVKVHIHVFDPSPVIDFARKYGEFIQFKLENMALQHNEQFVKERSKKEHFELEVIAPANGNGIVSLLESFSYVNVIKSDKTVNTSAQEFIQAIENSDADEIVIMPNNKNVLNSALQAVELSEKKNVTVIPTDNIAQCYWALAMDEGGFLSDRIKAMKDNVSSVKTIMIARATREVTINNVKCIKDYFVSYLDDRIVSCKVSLDDVLSDAINLIEDKSLAFVFKGKYLPGSTAFRIPDDIEVSVLDGGQDVFDLIVGVV